jgi:orotate phosphoribosyltransferase
MSEEILQIFKDTGALLEGHFELTSGLHSPLYWEKFRVLQFPEYTEKLCKIIAGHFKNDNIELVVGPTTGGVILAYETARQLGIRGMFAEKEGQTRVFRRGFTIKPGERILIVDDILTTGGSIKEVINAVKELEGVIIGIAVLVDRSSKDIDFGYPLFSCLKSSTVAYEPANCPQCATGVPLIHT